MRKLELANSIELILIITLFFSITVLMLNQVLPTVALKNLDNPDVFIYFNAVSMQYSSNIVIQNLFSYFNMINNLIWITIIFTVIALFGVMLNISKIHKKISYLLLSFSCLSIIFIIISFYMYISFVLKMVDFDDIILAYLLVEPVKYSYFIIIILILIVLLSISYNILALPIFIRVFKDAKFKKQRFAIIKSFTKPIEWINISRNKKDNADRGFYFKRTKEFTNNWVPNKNNSIEVKEDLVKSEIIKEKKDDESITKKNFKHFEENKSPFLEVFKDDGLNQKKNENDKVKFSKSFENALTSAIDKNKHPKDKR